MKIKLDNYTVLTVSPLRNSNGIVADVPENILNKWKKLTRNLRKFKLRCKIILVNKRKIKR